MAGDGAWLGRLAARLRGRAAAAAEMAAAAETAGPGTPEAKADPAPPGYLAWHAPMGQAVWTPRRYDRLAEEGYRRNVIAYRSVEEIARNAAAVPLRLERRADGERLAAHPLLDLLARPGPVLSGTAFRHGLVAHYLIGGNGFAEAVAPAAGAPEELRLWRPDQVHLVAGPGGVPAGFKLVEGGQVRRLPVDPLTGRSAMLHWKAFHPLDAWYGMSPLEAAGVAVDQFNAGAAWNQALLQNGAKPSGTLTSQEPLSETQFARLKEQIDELHQGARNAGRPMLLEGGLAWQEMGLSPRDMDYIEARHTAARDIASALGVPPQLLGIPGDTTFANYQEARLHFWENTMTPLVGALAEALGQWLLPQFRDETLRLVADLDGVPGLTPRRRQRWEAVRDADFLTLNEKRAAVGYGPVEGGDAPPAAGGQSGMS